MINPRPNLLKFCCVNDIRLFNFFSYVSVSAKTTLISILKFSQLAFLRNICLIKYVMSRRFNALRNIIPNIVKPQTLTRCFVFSQIVWNSIVIMNTLSVHCFYDANTIAFTSVRWKVRFLHKYFYFKTY